jgi:predicted metal-binding membrane protein
MRSGVNDDIVLAKLLRQDHAIVVLCASGIALLGWAYLFYQGWAMQHMDLVAMAMPSTGAWGPVDLLLVFAMWAVMMVAMMVPSVTPMLLAFATISRSGCAQGRTFVPLWVFLRLPGTLDGFQPRRHVGTVGTAQPSTHFPHDDRHEPFAR